MWRCRVYGIFRGLPSSDQSIREATAIIGIKEHMVFPEIVPEKVQHMFSFQVNIVTTAKNKAEGEACSVPLGLPLQIKRHENRMKTKLRKPYGQDIDLRPFAENAEIFDPDRAAVLEMRSETRVSARVTTSVASASANLPTKVRFLESRKPPGNSENRFNNITRVC